MTAFALQSPITLASLDAAIEKNNSIYQERLALFPPGTYDVARNDARDMLEFLAAARDWLVRSGKDSAQYIGPFGTISIKKGQRVVIKAGSEIRSTRGQPTVSTRKRVVTVHYIDEGYIDRSCAEPTVRQPVVTWAGAGGYWCRTALENVDTQASLALSAKSQ